jgi:hypothetical protein
MCLHAASDLSWPRRSVEVMFGEIIFGDFVFARKSCLHLKFSRHSIFILQNNQNLREMRLSLRKKELKVLAKILKFQARTSSEIYMIIKPDTVILKCMDASETIVSKNVLKFAIIIAHSSLSYRL